MIKIKNFEKRKGWLLSNFSNLLISRYFPCLKNVLLKVVKALRSGNSCTWWIRGWMLKLVLLHCILGFMPKVLMMPWTCWTCCLWILIVFRRLVMPPWCFFLTHGHFTLVLFTMNNLWNLVPLPLHPWICLPCIWLLSLFWSLYESCP